MAGQRSRGTVGVRDRTFLNLARGCLGSQQRILALAFQRRALDLRLHGCDGGLRGGDRRVGLRDAGLGVVNPGFLDPFRRLVVFEISLRRGEPGLGLFQLGAIVFIVQLDQRLTGLYRLEILDVHLAHRSGDARAQRNQVRPHICVVGLLLAPAALP